MLPGANCRTERYDWLGQNLGSAGFHVIAPVIEMVRPDVAGGPELPPMMMVTIPDFVETLAYGRRLWPELPVLAVGHSLGGSILLESFDPAEGKRNPRNQMPEDFVAVSDVALAVVLGASLQPEMAHFTLPHRRKDTALSHPESTELLFIGAELDGIATPRRIEETTSRYSGSSSIHTISGGNHWGWVEGVEDGDGTDLDGIAKIGKVEQQDITVQLILDQWDRLSRFKASRAS